MCIGKLNKMGTRQWAMHVAIISEACGQIY